MPPDSGLLNTSKFGQNLNKFPIPKVSRLNADSELVDLVRRGSLKSPLHHAVWTFELRLDLWFSS